MLIDIKCRLRLPSEFSGIWSGQTVANWDASVIMDVNNFERKFNGTDPFRCTLYREFYGLHLSSCLECSKSILATLQQRHCHSNTNTATVQLKFSQKSASYSNSCPFTLVHYSIVFSSESEPRWAHLSPFLGWEHHSRTISLIWRSKCNSLPSPRMNSVGLIRRSANSMPSESSLWVWIGLILIIHCGDIQPTVRIAQSVTQPDLRTFWSANSPISKLSLWSPSIHWSTIVSNWGKQFIWFQRAILEGIKYNSNIIQMYFAEIQYHPMQLACWVMTLDLFGPTGT